MKRLLPSALPPPSPSRPVVTSRSPTGGIVARADNDNLGVVGVAPKATVIGVKVLDNGSGSFGQIIDGIIYAADRIKDGGAGRTSST